MSIPWTSLVLGLLLGAGLWLVFVRLPFMRHPTLAQRIDPQLRSAISRSKLLDSEEQTVLFGPLERIFRLVVSDAVHRLGRLNLGLGGLQKRLRQAGREVTALEFRAIQLLCASAGLLAGVVFSLLLLWRGELNPLGAVAITVGAMLSGYLLYENQLSRQINKRKHMMLEEFPALAELMALAVGAGESAAGALDRVAQSSNGVLAAEFGQVLVRARTGTPLVEALQGFSQGVDIAALSRFADGISVAVNRGTPLAEVLRAQAQDVRDMAKRQLMEAAGKKEIAMMVPVIFGVLPLTVVFAVFPGLALLEFGF